MRLVFGPDAIPHNLALNSLPIQRVAFATYWAVIRRERETV